MGAFRDLTGKQFGSWAAVDRAPNKGNSTYWNCICGCGVRKPVLGTMLVNGQSEHCRSCGMLGKNLKDLVGRRFNRLLVENRAENRKKRTFWNCTCDCGKKVTVTGNALIEGNTQSCGCYKRDLTSERHRRRPHEATYNALMARGHRPCRLTYEDFLGFTKVGNCHYCDDVIPWQPRYSSAYFLDRKDNDIEYTVENCVVCCKRCNWTKSNRFSYKEWIEMGKTIKRLREETACQ